MSALPFEYFLGGDPGRRLRAAEVPDASRSPPGIEGPAPPEALRLCCSPNCFVRLIPVSEELLLQPACHDLARERVSDAASHCSELRAVPEARTGTNGGSQRRVYRRAR